jgi:predicted N-formylglutamate amidohydrolase
VIGSRLADAFEIVGADRAAIVLSCEHASNRLPAGWAWPAADTWIEAAHWAWDPGAAAITRALADALGAPAVLARFTRLLVDPNRDAASPTLFRDVADGRLIRMNESLPSPERQRRIATLYRPFHDAFASVVASAPEADLLSIHTFTPVYEGGPPRPMEIGVLFEREEALAQALAQKLDQAGWRVALNEPYSGQGGNMFSVDDQALNFGRRAIEIEVRQDVALDLDRRPGLVNDLIAAVEAVGMVRI